jgi:hypothetical protein
MVATPASWLFVLGEESIWILHAEGTMFVYGPGELQQCFRFETDAARDAYQISMTERLLGDGWMLWVDRDRRERHDRRRTPRETPDRRASPRTSPSPDGRDS